ncbi:MAG: N-acetylgalactosamine 6-sulfate sulfatase [Paenibacillaceae bacterium]|jgi:arylsulfatase A-like enzyme|nr:N-acetylgalactosamine 6-sulfate sulfatase [Paenibacillaceae bacterium]
MKRSKIAAPKAKRALATALSLAMAATLSVGCTRDTAKAPPDTDPSAARPNVVMIYADDLGYGDTRLTYARSIVDTQHLNSIADNGVLFTQGYTASPVCAPSRAAMLTSHYPASLGFDGNEEARDHPQNIPSVTIGTLLKDKGYATMAIGKWDLAGQGRPPERFMPTGRGFDGFFGLPGGIGNYYPKAPLKAPDDAWHIDKNNPPVMGGMIHNQWGTSYIQQVKRYDPESKKYVDVNEPQYLTEAFTREAIQYIDKQADSKQPFFLYLAYNATHVPLQAPDRYVEKYKNITDPRDRIYAAMVDALDDNVGKVLKELDDKGMKDNTMVIFISDNGPEAGKSGGLRGGKYNVFEGGIHMPYTIQWPAVYPRKSSFDKLVTTMDVLPTVAVAAGYSEQELKQQYHVEGTDLTPFISGKNTNMPHDEMFWRFKVKEKNAKQTISTAVRSGDFKYIQSESKGGKDEEYLYNIRQDAKETHNLINDDSLKSTLQNLKARLDKWNKDNPMKY